MRYEQIDFNVDGDGVALLRLARADKMNAFTARMCEELEHAFARASDDDAIRVIVVTAEGRAFCAGMDLSVEGNVFGLDESQKADRLKDWQRVRDTGGRVALAIHRCLKPSIAAVNGVAVGIGSTMLLPMDFRLASADARFGFVFARLGIVNEACSSFFLPRLVGLVRAKEWLLRGHIFSAEEALEGGLINKILPAENLLPTAMELAREIIDNTSAVSAALIRQMLNDQLAHGSPERAHQLESLGVYHTSMGDGREGVAAFKEKRPPRYNAKVSADMPPFFPWSEG